MGGSKTLDGPLLAFCILCPAPGAAVRRGLGPVPRTATRPPIGPTVASPILQVTVLDSAVSPLQQPVTFFWANQNPASPGGNQHGSQVLQSRWGPAPSPSVEPVGMLHSPQHRYQGRNGPGLLRVNSYKKTALGMHFSPVALTQQGHAGRSCTIILPRNRTWK